MSDQTIKEFVFDLSKITLDEALGILEYDAEISDPKYISNFAKAVKKCIVRGQDQLTGADLPAVVEAFAKSIMGGGTSSKN